MEITIDAFTELLSNKYIIVEAFREHSKASEECVTKSGQVQIKRHTWMPIAALFLF